MNKAWQNHTYPLVMASTVQFAALTLLAMLVYPGGTLVDPASEGYSFLTNFFSDLGLLTSYNGAPNLMASVLFVTTLALAGGGLVYFFMIFPAYFQGERYGRWLSLAGSLFGVVSGLAYVGVAFTPADLFIDAHVTFVRTAFMAFLGAVICYAPAILLHPRYPRWYAAVLLAFAALLAVYLWLLFFGPSEIRIQATGQKLIVYAAIGVIFIQAYGAHQFAQEL